jgi:hypothetical protein
MEAKDPLTSLALDVPYLSVKTRNTFADSIFYDVRSLSAEEQAQLNPLNDREGSVVVVPPSGKGGCGTTEVLCASCMPKVTTSVR